ncbi:MAG: hypothetical protein K6F71_01265 [Ruminococcus sp.]|nr:hypothetical protein [Ruminococcus sp.]
MFHQGFPKKPRSPILCCGGNAYHCVYGAYAKKDPG